jgi:hypothetical protein
LHGHKKAKWGIAEAEVTQQRFLMNLDIAFWQDFPAGNNL